MSSSKFTYRANELSSGDIVWYPPESSYETWTFDSLKIINPANTSGKHHVSREVDISVDLTYDPESEDPSR